MLVRQPHFAHKSALEGWLSSALFMQDVYAAKGSKSFWHYHIGYCKKQGNAKFTGTGCNSFSSRKGFWGTDFDATIPERICTG